MRGPRRMARRSHDLAARRHLTYRRHDGPLAGSPPLGRFGREDRPTQHAHVAALNLIPKLAWRGTDRASQEAVLTEVNTLASAALASAIQLNHLSSPMLPGADARKRRGNTRCPSGVTAIMVSRHHFLQGAEWVPDQRERPFE